MGERAYMSLDSQRGVAEKYANRLATVQHQSSSPP
jgi:hypothetical protein